jgi:membrane associated rhomboid family serine protease
MCFLGYGLMSIHSDDLLQWGANYRPAVLNGEFWRLFSSNFLHAGLYHLVPNMFVLWLVGPFLEPFLGRVKYTLAFLLTGAIASLSSIYWHEETVSVGASGAVFGLCGIFISLALTKKTSLRLGSDIHCPILGIIIAIVGCGLGSAFLISGIDHAAHIGGVLSGLVLGALIAQFSSKNALGFSSLK